MKACKTAQLIHRTSAVWKYLKQEISLGFANSLVKVTNWFHLRFQEKRFPLPLYVSTEIAVLTM